MFRVSCASGTGSPLAKNLPLNFTADEVSIRPTQTVIPTGLDSSRPAQFSKSAPFGTSSKSDRLERLGSSVVATPPLTAVSPPQPDVPSPSTRIEKLELTHSEVEDDVATNAPTDDDPVGDAFREVLRGETEESRLVDDEDDEIVVWDPRSVSWFQSMLLPISMPISRILQETFLSTWTYDISPTALVIGSR
jgi:hypothetical protein